MVDLAPQLALTSALELQEAWQQEVEAASSLQPVTAASAVEARELQEEEQVAAVLAVQL